MFSKISASIFISFIITFCHYKTCIINLPPYKIWDLWLYEIKWSVSYGLINSKILDLGICVLQNCGVLNYLLACFNAEESNEDKYHLFILFMDDYTRVVIRDTAYVTFSKIPHFL